MTRVTYLAHSGFVVELDSVITVFDYFRDPDHALLRILTKSPDKPVIFFVTHNHRDHFEPRIFELAQNHKRVYVVSNDVPAQVIPSTLNVAGMSPGDYIENLPGDLTVKAFGSTDAGVSYLVTAPTGLTIFHAGDLNDWHWMDISTLEEQARAHGEFEKIVRRIAADTHATIDIAMFPVDTRLGTDFAGGARYFLSHIRVHDFFPMHFNGDYHQACSFSTYAPAGVSCHCLHSPGESIELTYADACPA